MSSLVLFWTFLAILSYLKAIFIWLGILFWLIYTAGTLVKNRQFLTKPIFLAVLIFSLFTGFMYHEYPLGRDDAGYLTAAVKLGQTGQLSFVDFFSRPFHPFRDLNNDPNLFTSQFLPAYSAYLAGWFVVSGESGIFWSNSILVFFILLIIYGIGCLFKNKRLGWLSFGLVATFYASFWFWRRTNSENLFMFNFWLAAYLLLAGLKFRRWRYVLAGFVPVSLLMLIRGEGFVYTIIYLLIAFILLIKQASLVLNQNSRFRRLGNQIILLSPVVVFIFYWLYAQRFGGSYLWQHFYDLRRTILNNFLSQPVVFLPLFGLALILSMLLIICFYKKIKIEPIIRWAIISLLILVIILKIFLDYYFFQDTEAVFSFALFRGYFTIKILSAYLLLVPLVLVILALAAKQISASKQKLVYLTFLVSPSFLFLFDPFIALDQPWFLRRFYPVFIPYLLIITAWCVYHLPLSKLCRRVLILILLASQLAIAGPIIFFKDNKGTVYQIDKLAAKLNSLSDKESHKLFLMTPGWSWQQWAYELHYLKSLDVLPKLDGISEEEFRIKLNEYDQVYIISQDRQDIFLSPYAEQPQSTLENPNPEPILLFDDNQLKLLNYIRLEYPSLEKTCPMTSYIFSQGEAISPQRFSSHCFKEIVPVEIDYIVTDLYIYELLK